MRRGLQLRFLAGTAFVQLDFYKIRSFKKEGGEKKERKGEFCNFQNAFGHINTDVHFKPLVSVR